MNSQTRQIIYLLLAVTGLILTWYHNVLFMMDNGTNLLTFIGAMGANYATLSIGWDIVIAFMAFAFWLPHEARRTGVRHWWVFLVLGGCIAFAFSFPLFLFFRERRLAQAS